MEYNEQGDAFFIFCSFFEIFSPIIRQFRIIFVPLHPNFINQMIYMKKRLTMVAVCYARHRRRLFQPRRTGLGS